MELCEWDGSSAAKATGGGNGGAVVDAGERHKLAERERRKSMRELFLSLHSLLPNASTVRKEQSAILDLVIKHIPLAASRLRSLQSRRGHSGSAASPPPLVHLTMNRASSSSAASATVTTATTPSPSASSSSSSASLSSGRVDYDIRVAPEPSSSVSIRVRGERVNVSVTDTKGTAHSVLLSTVIDELEKHHLKLVRSTHCRDGSKLLHYSESKIGDDMRGSPATVKESLQDLARKVHSMRKAPSAITLKRSSDHLSSMEDEGCI